MAVERNADDRLEAFAIGTSNDFFHVIQSDPDLDEWSGWEPLGKSKLYGIGLATAKNGDGRLEAFAIDTSFDFWHIWQPKPGLHDWSDWKRLGKPTIKGQKLVIARNADDRLEAFAIDTSKKFWHKRQNFAGAQEWSDWMQLGGSWLKCNSLAVAANSDGRLEAFAIDTSYNFWHIWQLTPSSVVWFNDWTRLGGQADRGGSLAVERNRRGQLEAFAIGVDSFRTFPPLPPGGTTDFWHTLQKRDPLTNVIFWSAWTRL